MKHQPITKYILHSGVWRCANCGSRIMYKPLTKLNKNHPPPIIIITNRKHVYIAKHFRVNPVVIYNQLSELRANESEYSFIDSPVIIYVSGRFLYLPWHKTTAC